MSIEVSSLKLALSNIEDCYEELVDRAQMLVDGYWVEWKEKNKQIAALNFRPGEEGYMHTGRIAPRVKRLKSTHRVYLEWWDWKKTPYRKFQNPRAGIQIKPSKRSGYTWASMSKHANAWEKQLFDKYEPLFIKIRKPLALIADQISLLKKLIKALSTPVEV